MVHFIAYYCHEILNPSQKYMDVQEFFLKAQQAEPPSNSRSQNKIPGPSWGHGITPPVILTQDLELCI